jgi:hypothetical protein
MIDFLIPKVSDPKEAHNLSNAPRWDFFSGIDTKPQVRCQCGEWLDLTDYHIDESGNISPSLEHETGCGWHVMAHLHQWDGPAMMAGEP